MTVSTAPPPLLAPGEPGWDEARTAWNLAIDQQPAAIALPRSANEVAAAVRTARERGLPVMVQGTGHGAGPVRPDGAMLIRTGALTDIRIDASARRAHLGAGVPWGLVAGPAAEHGLAGSAGSSPSVGVVGYLLGGGHGWLSGRHGLAPNDLVAAEVVTGAGDIVRLDDDSDPEAMWALRGGGGAFAAVTAVEVGLHEVSQVAGGGLMWPIERAGEILEAWRTWSAAVPEGVMTLGRILRFPPIEPVPPPVRGRSFVIVEAADVDGIERLNELLAPLRELGPELDMIRPMPATELSQIHMDPPEPVPASGTGMLLSSLEGDTVAAAVAAVAEGPGEALIGIEIRRLGGAVARSRRPGVRTAVDEAAAVFAVGVAASPDLAAATGAGLAAVREGLAPWRSPLGIMNLAEADAVTAVFSADELARLGAVADRLDPDGAFLRRR